MSDTEPKEPYIYQPGRPVYDDPDPKIYALGGPGTQDFCGRRFTRKDAEILLDQVKLVNNPARHGVEAGRI